MNTSVMILGEAPGLSEENQGRVFVGPAGQLLDSWVTHHLGWDRENISYANAVSCFPHRTPRKSEIDACRHNLWMQLQYVRPQYILLVGSTAVKSWWPELGVENVP